MILDSVCWQIEFTSPAMAAVTVQQGPGVSDLQGARAELARVFSEPLHLKCQLLLWLYAAYCLQC